MAGGRGAMQQVVELAGVGLAPVAPELHLGVAGQLAHGALTGGNGQ